jgi:hypothetical protein
VTETEAADGPAAKPSSRCGCGDLRLHDLSDCGGPARCSRARRARPAPPWQTCSITDTADAQAPAWLRAGPQTSRHRLGWG